MSWTAILVLAAGAYGFKLAGVLVGTRIERPLLRRSVSLVPPLLGRSLSIHEKAGLLGTLS